MLQYSFQTYLQEIKDLGIKIDMMDKIIEDISNQERYKDKVDKLVCFTGVETHTALTLVCEVGDFNRFPSAKDFSSYIDL
ncbi:transposase [uncultured Sphaerochaeta sp.]|uniref:transposase n=1 Tax=uncultured Sphaerochaeta sp. TaxID=886478 RepID=UPI00374A1827